MVCDVDDPVSLLVSLMSVEILAEKQVFLHWTASVTDAAVDGLKKYIGVNSNISLQFHILHNTLPSQGERRHTFRMGAIRIAHRTVLIGRLNQIRHTQ